ncbi:MAG: hypothetical protein ACT4PZ_01725 [Panacagrimonas sp.]
MHTLGYSEDERLPRSHIAKVQLVKAIELFITEQFIPSITLAGAAEEIFGKLLNHQGQKPILEQSFEEIQRIREATGRQDILGGKNKKETIEAWNKARNNLKHHGNTEEDFVVINTCDEAYWMIKRALDNASRLGVKIPNGNEFENWVVININM